MNTDKDTPTDDGLSEEAAKLAELGRQGRTGEPAEDANPEPIEDAEASEGAEDGAQEEGEQRPEWLPEKFKSPEDFAKAYAELEKKQSEAGKDAEEDPKEDSEEGSEGDEEADPSEAFTADLQSKVQSAQEEYAESGELSEDTYSALSDLLGQDYLDNYLAGVKALEEKMTSAVYEAAGDEQLYASATEWAKDNWSEAKVEKFNNALNDPDLMPVMVKSLMDDFNAANPSEGQFTEARKGGVAQDLYSDKDEFLKDLAEADANNDALARRKATQKLQRSKKAGTLKEITPRTGLGRFG